MTQIHTQKMLLCEDKGRDWSDAVTNQETPPRSGKSKKRLSPRALGESTDLLVSSDLRLLPFRTVREHVSVDSSHQVGDKLIIATLGKQGKVSVSSSLKWVTLNSYCEVMYLKATRTVPGALEALDKCGLDQMKYILSHYLGHFSPGHTWLAASVYNNPRLVKCLASEPKSQKEEPQGVSPLA